MFRRREGLPRPVAALLALSLGLAGCGNSRTSVPDASQLRAPTAMRWLTYPTAGVTLRVPRNWAVEPGSGPLLGTISTGPAIVAVWRYARSTPPPADAAGLSGARTALVAAARRRDPALEPIRIQTARLGGWPAIELDAFEHLSGQLRRVRSLHVFVPGAEIVLDEYAPPASFHPIDHQVFSPVKRSLRLSTPTS